MRERFCRKWKKICGYTLAEVLIVVGILAILAAVSFPALINMRDSLRQTELDETAKQIFITAQNKMSGMKLRGEELSGMDGRKEISPEDAWKPSDLPENGVRPDSYVICNEIGEPGDLEFTWMNDTAFAPAFVEQDGGCYVIEYNEKTGTVYGVFYWEKSGGGFQKKSTFAYPAGFNSHEGKLLRGDENRANRMEPSVGYYGGEAAAQGNPVKPLEFEFTVKNGARLEAELKLPVALYQDVTLELELSSKTEGGETAVYHYLMKNGFITAVSDEAKNQNLGKIWQSRNTDGRGYGTYTLLLDSLEGGLHFADHFSGITAGDDLKLLVKGYSVGGDTVYAPQSKTAEINSLFGGIRGGAGWEEARIENGRHLQNLSFEVSGLGSRRDASEEEVFTDKPVRRAKLLNDIDWQAEDAYDTAGGMKSYDEVSTNRGLGEPVNFYPISTDKTGLVLLEGNHHRILNLNVTRSAEILGSDGKTYAYAGLFGYMKEPETAYDGGGKPVNTIRNLDLVNPKIRLTAPSGRVQTEDSYAGSLGGYLSTVRVENCRAYIEDGSAAEDEGFTTLYKEAGVRADGYFYTGGLIGMAVNLWAGDSSASLKVSGGQYAGGLIGRVSNSGQGTNDITRCYAGGSTENGSYDPNDPNISGVMRAGGLIGMLPEKGMIRRSFSTCSVKGTGAGAGTGAFAGSAAAEDLGLELKATYGMGAVFAGEDGTSNDFGCGTVEEALADGGALLGEGATRAYDVRYRREKAAYPYPVWQDSYYGDWPEEETVTGFVYYEVYQTDDGMAYGFWSPGEEGLDSLSNEYTVLGDGYGYVSDIQETVRIRRRGQGGEKEQELEGSLVKTAGASKYLYPLPWKDWTHIHYSEFDKWNTQAGETPSFYDHITLAVGPKNSGAELEIYFNPHFAKAVVTDEAAARTGPETVSVRTARHLYELAALYTVNYTPVENQAYWSADWTYKQERDIDYGTYAPEFAYMDYTDFARLEQRVIGTSDDRAFSAEYDGGGFRISNLDMSNYTTINWNEMTSFFGYVSHKGSVKNMTLVRPVIVKNQSSIAGLVYHNKGTVSNVTLISPYLLNTGWDNVTAGLAVKNSGTIENCFVVPQQKEYEPEEGPYRHRYDGGNAIEVNNYTNAYISGYTKVSGFVGENEGTIRNCGVAASVFSTRDGIAAGFLIDNKTNGRVEYSYANCYTAGRQGAAGFVYHTDSDSIIDGCYALRRVTNTGGYGYAAGFAADDMEGTITNSYAAVSVGYSAGYTADHEGTITYPDCKYDKGLWENSVNFQPFSRSRQSNCYYMEWAENYTRPDGSGNANASAVSYRELSRLTIAGLVSARPDGSDTEGFSRMLPSVYPFPKAPDATDPHTGETFPIIQYGDWPNYEYVGAEMTYFEIYKDGGGNYLTGFYNDALQLDTLREDLPIFLDGYGLLFDTDYLDMDGVGVEGLIQGSSAYNDKAYITWNDNLGTDNNTRTNYLKSVYDMRDNQGEEITDNVYYKDAGGTERKIEPGSGYADSPLTLKVNGRESRFYFRILPPAAAVTNAYVEPDSVFQELTVTVTSAFYDEVGGSWGEEIEKERTFYYCPHFAKSWITTEKPVREPDDLIIRTPRHLSVLSIKNNRGGSTGITNYYDKSFRQERDIDFGTTGSYAYYYVDAPMDNSTRGARSAYRWFNSSIGDKDHMFTGSYDGQGHRITGLGSWPADIPLEPVRQKDSRYKATTTNADVPLFGFVSGGAELKRITVSGSSLTFSQSSEASPKGVLTGKLLGNARLTECAVKDSSITGTGSVQYMGMGAGYVSGGTIDCLVLENFRILAAGGTHIGGAAGYIDSGTVKHVKISGSNEIKANRAAGGMIGQIKSGTGEVTVSSSSIGGNFSITQMQADRGTEVWNGVGLAVGLCEMGNRPVYVGELDISSGPGETITVTSDSGSKFYTAGMVFGSIYTSEKNSGILSVGSLGIHGAVLHMETPSGNKTCSYGGLAGAVGYTEPVTVIAKGDWDFKGSRITVLAKNAGGQYQSDSGAAGLIGSVRNDMDLTLPRTVTLPDVEVRTAAGHGIAVSGMVNHAVYNNNKTVMVALRSPVGAHSDIFLGQLVTENCENTGGVTHVMNENMILGELFLRGSAGGGHIEASGNVGGIAGTIDLKGTGDKGSIRNLSVENIYISGAGNLGGFAGLLKRGTIEQSFASADVTVSFQADSSAGGFAGRIDTPGSGDAVVTISQCYASGISGPDAPKRSGVHAGGAETPAGEWRTSVMRAGGFFGEITSTSRVNIDGSYSTGDVTIAEAGAERLSAAGGFGGFLADDSDASISGSYSLGEVVKEDKRVSNTVHQGGFVGYIPSGSSGVREMEIENPGIVDSLLLNLIQIMKQSVIYNRVPEQNGKSVWDLNIAMDSDTRGIWRKEAGNPAWMSALVYNVLGYPSYMTTLSGAYDQEAGAASDEAIESAYNALFGEDGSLKPDDHPGSYYSTFYVPARENGLMEKWMLKNGYIYWVNAADDKVYRVNLKNYARAADGGQSLRSRISMIEIGEKTVSYTTSKSYTMKKALPSGENPEVEYRAMSVSDNDIWIQQERQVMFDCYFLREHGETAGLLAYNSDYTDLGGAKGWTVADFAAEMRREAAGGGASFPAMRPDAGNTSVSFDGYPYPLLDSCGAGTSVPLHVGGWPAGYHPVFAPRR